MKILGLIPARFHSTRFPGKLLKNLLNKPIIQHTFEHAKQCSSIDDVYVATDDLKIAENIEKIGGKVIFTSESCKNGTERIIEAIEKTPDLQKYDVFINLQGDHPFVCEKTIQALIDQLASDPRTLIATAVIEISAEKAKLPQVVKCVFDCDQRALYFSREKIPHNGKKYYQHVGIYAYRMEFLQVYKKLKTSSLEEAEDLEQLRFLENGYAIKVALVNEISYSVDTPEDLSNLENYLCQ